jgi:pimeloyl-ACP methyl ester carboxylesterase
MSDSKAYKLDTPGAILHYDIRSNDSTTEPPILLFGSPMPASGFGALAGYFTDRTVVTYDPRGSERSKRTDGAANTSPDEHVDDLHRLVLALDAGPVDMFATSGGAVNALAFAASYPQQVRILVAHEPPTAQVLPDCETIAAVAADIRETYDRSGYGHAMAKFIAIASYQGPVPADYLDQPAPDPAAFGLPAIDDGSRDDPLVGLNMPSCIVHEHDFAALRAAPARIVLGRGEDTGESLTARAATAFAERLGTELAMFPGGHTGFCNVPGMPGKPEAFAKTLRDALAGMASRG